MIAIPEEFSDSIVQLIEWHLKAYMPDKVFNTHLERILECFFIRNRVNGLAQIDASELCYINECVSNAANNISDCGIAESKVWDMHDWVVAERKKST